jgi:hypothetical protein
MENGQDEKLKKKKEEKKHIRRKSRKWSRVITR